MLTQALRHAAQVQGARMLREEVTEADIADIISKWTGIPVSKLVASEREKLLHLDAELHRRVIGQDEAVQAVADAIQRCVDLGFQPGGIWTGPVEGWPVEGWQAA